MAPPAPESASESASDPLRDRLLDAAARVFARQGYAGTRILDVVREAGLSTGAVYARFASKNDLLRAAVVERTRQSARAGIRPTERVADLLVRIAERTDGPLTDGEAVRLEAFVTARREPEVAAVLDEANADWRAAVQPIVDAAMADGTVDPALDPEAVLHLVRTLSLGLLLQRGAGVPAPDPVAWAALIQRVVASFAVPPVPTTVATTTS